MNTRATKQRRTLADYPYATVNVACRFCNRRGRYRLDGLLEAHGGETPFDELLTRLSADCTRSMDRTHRPGGCLGPHFPDLDGDR